MCKGLHELLTIQVGNDARRNTTSNIDTTGCKYFKGKIASLSSENRDKDVERSNTKFACIFLFKRIVHDNWRLILRCSQLLGQPCRLLAITTLFEISVNAGYAFARADALETHIPEARHEVAQQFDFKLVG